MEPGTRLKRWILLVGIAGFVTGATVGASVNMAWGGADPDDGPYLSRLQDEYALTPKQMRLVRGVLKVRDREILQAYTQLSERLSPGLRRRIEEIHMRADDRIEAVLDSTQREQYRKARKSESR